MDMRFLGDAWSKLIGQPAVESQVAGIQITMEKFKDSFHVSVHSDGSNAAYPREGQIELYGFKMTRGRPVRDSDGYIVVDREHPLTRLVVKEADFEGRKALTLSAFVAGKDEPFYETSVERMSERAARLQAARAVQGDVLTPPAGMQ